ncbi:MAG: hypothetical protein M1820_005560 [Bogoriella megaspora]|nr:MAG: hypothetical protein M1820_005560 [Bogoriella megaspora]
MASHGFAHILYTPRLVLKLCDSTNPEHLDDNLRLLNAPETVAQIGDTGMCSHAQISRWMRAVRIHPSRMSGEIVPVAPHKEAVWLVYLKSSETSKKSQSMNEGTVNRVIGVISIGHRSKEIPPDVGWLVDAAHWSKGYATEAAREIVRYATEDLGIESLIAFPLETNIPSIKTSKKVGFVDGGRIADQNGRTNMVFVLPSMKWRANEGLIVNFMGDWDEVQEVCECTRCNGREIQD